MWMGQVLANDLERLFRQTIAVEPVQHHPVVDRVGHRTGIVHDVHVLQAAVLRFQQELQWRLADIAVTVDTEHRETIGNCLTGVRPERALQPAAYGGGEAVCPPLLAQQPPSALPLDAVQFIQYEVGHVPEQYGACLVISRQRRLATAQQKSKLSSDQRSGNTVEHSSVDRVALKQRKEPEADGQVDDAANQNHHLRRHAQVLEAIDQQHGNDGGREGNCFP